MPITCFNCLGCGLIADTPDREPWLFWRARVPAKDFRLPVGTVYPMLCPLCDGIGEVPWSESSDPAPAPRRLVDRDLVPPGWRL